MESQLVVIGGGPGGYAAAFLAADLGMNVTLIEQEPQLGGVCLQRGCIPSKALLHVAKTMGDAQRLADWGIAFDKPQIDLDALRARKAKVIDTLAAGLGQLSTRRHIDLIQARAHFIDSHSLKLEPVDGDVLDVTEVRFDHCIVATGSLPGKIPAFDPPAGRVMDSTAALDLPEIPKSLLVIGGGYIGLEIATIYAALGTKVSVVEMTDGLLPGVDRDLVRPLQRELAGQIEAIHLNTKVVGITVSKSTVEVTFDGDEAQGAPAKKVKRFARVLISVGRRPNSGGLSLKNTKVKVTPDGFLQVDSRQRTSDKRILAIGDVAGGPMLAHKASHQGRVAVESLTGKQSTFEPKAIPAVVFTDPEIAWAGLTATEAKQQGRPVDVAQFPWAANGRSQAEGRTIGMTKWLVDPEDDRVLGCGIVGPGAGDLIAEAVLAIEMGAEIDDLADVIHPHPTRSETLGGAAEVYLGTATDLYRPKRER